MSETVGGAAFVTGPLRVAAARKARTARVLAARAMYRLCGKSDFTWRYIANLRPSLEYRHSMRRSFDESPRRRLLADLRRDGIVVTSVYDLMGPTTVFEDLQAAVERCEAAVAAEIQGRRLKTWTPAAGRGKSYVFSLLGSPPALDANDIFARFALNPALLSVVNAYYGMFTKLRYYNVWYNFPTNEEPKEAQLWHRDPEDRAILKVFAYLVDVGEENGPLWYAPGTHAFGPVKTRPESRSYREGRSTVRRTDDTEMNAVVPREQWIRAVGPKGTVVLVDTRGYHKGGFVRRGERVVYTCMFTSQASPYPELFSRRSPVPAGLDGPEAFAIGK